MKQVGALLCCACILSSAAFAGEEEYLYFHGDIHSHTGYSDGVWWSIPAYAYVHARYIAGLDFYCVTDHFRPADPGGGWSISSEEYELLKAVADGENHDGAFVTLYGYEWTLDGTHANVFMASDLIRAVTIEDFYPELFDQRLADRNVFGKFNHPDASEESDWDGWAYSSKGAWCMRLMEVRYDFPPALNRAGLSGEIRDYAGGIENGWLIGVDGSKDTHGDGWGEFGEQDHERFNTVALATALTREGIIDALQMRRTYVSQDTDFQTNPLKIELRASKDGGITHPYIIGEAVDAEGIPRIDLRLTVKDGEADYLRKVSIYKNGDVVAGEDSIHSLDYTLTYTDTSPSNGDYYFAFIIEEDEEFALTSAIFVRNGDADADGLSDEEEINIIGTNPSYHDTDSDGFSDGDEVAAGTDPLDPNNYPVPVTPTEIPTVTPTTAPTITPPAPDVDIRISSSTVGNGDRFTVDVTFNDDINQPFDGYCVIVLPDESCFSFACCNEFVKGLAPLVSSVPALRSGYSARLVDLVLKDVAPSEYKLIVGVVPEHATPCMDAALCGAVEKVVVR